MEACCCTTIAQTFSHFKSTSIPPLPCSLLLLKGHILKPIKKTKQFPLAPSSLQFSHPQHPSRRFVASAAPPTADNTVADKLPADIQVTETPEPKSRPLLRDLPQIPTLSDVPQAIKEASVRLLDAFVDHVFEFVDQPCLPSQSNFAPVDEIGEAMRVTCIHGRIPDDFPQGVYLRNGSNPIHGGLKSAISIFGKSSEIWVEGEGMIHALYLSKEINSSSSWITVYNNKYVKTEAFKMENERKKPAFLPAVEGAPAAVLSGFLLNLLRFGKVNKNLSNTSVFEHSGNYYSISENDLPQEIDIRTLETIGNWDSIVHSWNRPFTSHPKKAPETG